MKIKTDGNLSRLTKKVVKYQYVLWSALIFLLITLILNLIACLPDMICSCWIPSWHEILSLNPTWHEMLSLNPSMKRNTLIESYLTWNAPVEPLSDMNRYCWIPTWYESLSLNPYLVWKTFVEFHCNPTWHELVLVLHGGGHESTHHFVNHLDLVEHIRVEESVPQPTDKIQITADELKVFLESGRRILGEQWVYCTVCRSNE